MNWPSRVPPLMTESPQQPIGFTMMYVTHNALRRDLSHFATAVAANRAASPGVRAGWQNFKAQRHPDSIEPPPPADGGVRCRAAAMRLLSSSSSTFSPGRFDVLAVFAEQQRVRLLRGAIGAGTKPSPQHQRTLRPA
jgi:hypothetical protein